MLVVVMVWQHARVLASKLAFLCSKLYLVRTELLIAYPKDEIVQELCPFLILLLKLFFSGQARSILKFPAIKFTKLTLLRCHFFRESEAYLKIMEKV